MSTDRLCVNMTERDIRLCGRVCVFCSVVRVMKHRADSGADVKGPCSSENGSRGEWREEERGN